MQSKTLSFFILALAKRPSPSYRTTYERVFFFPFLSLCRHNQLLFSCFLIVLYTFAHLHDEEGEVNLETLEKKNNVYLAT